MDTIIQPVTTKVLGENSQKHYHGSKSIEVTPGNFKITQIFTTDKLGYERMADTEIPEEDSATPVADNTPQPKRKALSRIKRELTDEDLASPGVQKLLIDQIEKTEEQLNDLERYRDKFYQTDKDLAVSNGKLKRHGALEILSSGALAVGGAAVGYAPNAWASQPTGYMVLGIGIVLFTVGLVVKVKEL